MVNVLLVTFSQFKYKMDGLHPADLSSMLVDRKSCIFCQQSASWKRWLLMVAAAGIRAHYLLGASFAKLLR